MTLTEFLLARIAEDEAWVWRADDPMTRLYDHFDGFPDEDRGPSDLARVLAECEAKRRIVERLQCVQQGDTTQHAWHEQGLFEAVHLLCDAYADHPDYRQEWKP